MAICKCKMCGGDLHIEETDKVVECEYCGTTQTVPSADSEKKMTLFNRANRLRLANEFDKAAGIYENIIAEFPEEAEAYWGAVLCKYGIEYVDDPATGKKIPTCHRSSFDSVMEDENFEQACENADVTARRVYREEAKRLEEIRKGIIEVSAEEAPYDIFICYKENDENGDRTVDSAIAQDVYTALTEKGYRVFFSRISLEDKLGQEYEPYIFAALNSAKLMLVFGTDYEYFNAVWVKNEWSRFLKLIAAGQKKALIPCYKDIDAYDMPKEFAKLQSQDMGKVGAIQDLLRGVDKIFGKGTAQPAQAVSVQTPVAANPASATVDTLLKRAFMFLEDGNWKSADEYAEKVLDIEPENAEAYLAKAMASVHVRQRKDLSRCQFVESKNIFKKVLQYGNEELKEEINGYISNYRKIRELIEEANRREKEEKKRRVMAVVKALKNGYQSNTAPTLDEKYAAVKTDIENLERIQRVFDTKQAQIFALQNEFNSAISRERQLSEQRSHLGMFAAKAKKRIDEEVEAIAAKIKKGNYKSQIEKLQKSIGCYTSIVDVENDLNESRNRAANLEAQIKSEHAKNDTTYSFEDAVKTYLHEPNLAREVVAVYPAALFIPAMQGQTNIVRFGKYIQERYSPSKPIEWQVLSREKGRMLLISRFALDCQQYSSIFSANTWETCTLRKWLNSTFLSEAFTAKERTMIPTVTVTADTNPAYYKTNPGNSTTDQVFLLSISEVKKYFNSNNDCQCQGTDYCFMQGASKGENGNCRWWLRTPGVRLGNASGVNANGTLDCFGDLLSDTRSAVRPAIWVNLA